MSTYQCTTIPQELQCFDIQARNGELTAQVRVADALRAADWLIAKGYADSRLKAALRKAVARA